MLKILVAVDFSEITHLIIRHTRAIIENRPSQIWLIHITPPEPDFIGYETGPQTVRNHVAERFKEEHNQIQALAEELRQPGQKTVGLLLQGATVQTIVEQAQKLGVDLIIVGCHGRTGLIKTLVGSVSEGVLRYAPCPVLMIPNHLIEGTNQVKP